MLKCPCPVVKLTRGENAHASCMVDATLACIVTTANASDLATTSAPAPRALVARVVIGRAGVHWYDLASLLPSSNNSANSVVFKLVCWLSLPTSHLPEERPQFPLDIFHDHLTDFASLPDFGSSLRITSLPGYRSVNSCSTVCESVPFNNKFSNLHSAQSTSQWCP